jgi:signal transduction histidine kinase/CheY-like chemotaxis protein
MTPASPQRRYRLLIGGVSVLLVLALSAVAMLQWRQQRLLDATVRYQDDYLQISLAQLQVEYLRLRAALARAVEAPQPDRDAVQLRYDIFVSRVDLLRSGRAERLVGDPAEFRAAVAQAGAFIDEADQVLGPQPRRALDGQAARVLLDRMAPMDAAIQALVLDASHAVSAHVAQRYDEVRDQGRVGVLLTVLLSGTSVGLALFAFALLRHELQRRRALQSLTDELRGAREAAEAGSHAKSTFLANMSHELRTPFQGLLGSLQLLDGAPLDAVQRRHLRLARDAGRHLLAILNDVLDAARLEAGTLKVGEDSVAPRELVDDVRALMAGPAAEQGLALHAHVDPAVPARVRLDATRVRQVLFNLLSNAIKFTPPQGRVDLELSVRGEELVLAVADTGVGMDAATMSRLFQRFSQGDESTSRRHGGTGLGLEISRQLAQLMGGDIDVASVPGRGSRFELRLPLRRCDEPAPPPAPQPRAAGRLQLLVAEDNEVNREVLAAMIDHLGHDARFAPDGHAAVQAIVDARFDLVLMDLHMPGMDGFDAARAIRAMAGERAALPIVALTADAFEATRERCLEVGMDGFLGKPVSLDELARVIERHAAARQIVGTNAASSPMWP